MCLEISGQRRCWLINFCIVVCGLLMASRGKDSVGHAGKMVVSPSFVVDNIGVYIKVTCGSASGHLYLDQLGESK